MSKPADAPEIDAVDRTIAVRLREARRRRNLTLDELAARVGISAQQVLKYETGGSRLSAGRLKALADALGVDPGWLFPHPSQAPGAKLTAEEVARLERLKATRPAVFERICRLVEDYAGS